MEPDTESVCDNPGCQSEGAVQNRRSKKYLCRVCWKKLRDILSWKGLSEWKILK